MSVKAKEHWERVYRKTPPQGLSWYQAHPETSLSLIESTGIERDRPIIDVGGGASALADELLDLGFIDVTVLDISSAALGLARSRLGGRAPRVEWICTDVTRFEPTRRFALWHDRATFHFLVDHSARKSYCEALERALAADGHLIISTFAPSGPPRCSGLNVVRYSEDSLAKLLGRDFILRESRYEDHLTPSGTVQPFVFCHFVRQRG